MSVGMKTSRAQVWLENLDDWSWPGRGAAATEVLPPSWVPTFPPRLESAVAVAGIGTASDSWQPQRAIAPWLGTALLSALVAVCALLAIDGPLRLERLIGIRATNQASVVTPAAVSTAPPGAGAGSSPSLPTLVAASHDAAGSSIDTASYPSVALHKRGSLLVYLPTGYASTTRRYPVLYLLHGNNQLASAFLQIGLQAELDRLIARHEIPPLIAVMIQGGRGPNNWRAFGGQNYESYVLEVQELVDRTLPTVADRNGRAIAGDSMGGYGAMNLALSHPDRFAAVESWLGFFNGLQGELHADRPLLSRMGLRAFVYGGAADTIADPSENLPFAAQLRAAGASARGAVYPGGHSLETIQAHLGSMLVFAGRALSRSVAPPPNALPSGKSPPRASQRPSAPS
jgi:enterochelin esterase-like enzyme